MKKAEIFTAKQVGERIKECRLGLGLSMPELGKRVGVNKSTIQRYEADGVDPKRTMIINGLADALLTTPEWLTGLSDDKEYDSYTLCQRDIEEHIKKYLDTVSSTVNCEPHQQLLTTFLGKLIDLYSVLCHHFADAMTEVDRVAKDESLKQSLMRYAIESGAITERVYRKEMELPIEDMKRFLDGILHIYDEGRTAVKIGDLFGIVTEAEARLSEKNNSALLPIQIAYYTGLRIGEVCGLTWQDINLDGQYLTVRRSMRYNGARHKTEIGTTKRKKIRTVDFCDTLTSVPQ